MAFSLKQQINFRALVAIAWKRHCALAHVAPSDKAAKETWYRENLHAAAGISTTKDASPTRDFVPIMAHFEAIGGEGIYWQQRVSGDDLRRKRYALDELITEYDVDTDYVIGIARRNYDTARLETLNAAQLGGVIAALKNSLGLYERPTKSQPDLTPV